MQAVITLSPGMPAPKEDLRVEVMTMMMTIMMMMMMMMMAMTRTFMTMNTGMAQQVIIGGNMPALRHDTAPPT